MRYSVFESAHAARDLDMAVSYLVNTLKTKSAATKLLKEYEKKYSGYELKQRITAALYSKGFRMEDIRKITEE